MWINTQSLSLVTYLVLWEKTLTINQCYCLRLLLEVGFEEVKTNYHKPTVANNIEINIYFFFYTRAL